MEGAKCNALASTRRPTVFCLATAYDALKCGGVCHGLDERVDDCQRVVW